MVSVVVGNVGAIDTVYVHRTTGWFKVYTVPMHLIACVALYSDACRTTPITCLTVNLLSD